jgi:hypothetical protein
MPSISGICTSIRTRSKLPFWQKATASAPLRACAKYHTGWAFVEQLRRFGDGEFFAGVETPGFRRWRGVSCGRGRLVWRGASGGLVREQVRAHDGFEVKARGDGFMLAFRSARHGLQCAIDIQRSFDRRKQPADASLRVRIGLHTGEVVREADDFYGRHVNLASRIADQAQGGEILVSALLKELAAGSSEFAFDEGRDVNLKGLSGEQRVFTLVWDEGREG